METLTAVLAFLIISGGIHALDNGLARTPPMGWMTWQRFRCVTDCDRYPNECISDKLIRDMVDFMASDGYLEAGYEYIIIDDCWLENERDENDKLIPHRTRFPYGMKDLADYVHGKGLKFGMYQDMGTRTCAGYPGSKGYFEIDAKSFAEWEVDYIKIDGCNAELLDYTKDFTDFGRYLNETGRPMVYSCVWPLYLESKGFRMNYTYVAEVCNLWRNWGDLQDSYKSFTGITDWFVRNQDRFVSSASPGGWNDPDELLVGNYGLSYEQGKSQMAIWTVMASPLIMSVDLRTIEPEFKELLLHKEVIALNQDVLGIQGRMVKRLSNMQIWTRPISPIVNGEYSYAVAVHSRRDDGIPFPLKITLAKYGLTNAHGYVVRDVFEPLAEDQHIAADEEFIVRVKPSGVVLLRVTPIA